MPEQNAFPAPVRISTRADELATSSKRRQQLLDQFVADRVALVGTIESDRGDTTVIPYEECFVIHFNPLL